MNQWIIWMLDVLFPPHCAYCNKVLAHGSVCSDCAAQLSRIGPPVCMCCGMSLRECDCGRKKHEYSKIIAPFYYSGRVVQGIRRFKFEDKPQLASVFAQELADSFGQYYSHEAVDAVCAVPMRPKREKERGYNQSALLAKETARLLELPFMDRLLVKVMDTPAQHGLDAHLRTGNVLGAFDVDEQARLSSKRILLVDDIKTTGATLNECAKMLKLAGAQSVVCLCLAITPRKKAGK